MDNESKLSKLGMTQLRTMCNGQNIFAGNLKKAEIIKLLIEHSKTANKMENSYEDILSDEKRWIHGRIKHFIDEYDGTSSDKIISSKDFIEIVDIGKKINHDFRLASLRKTYDILANQIQEYVLDTQLPSVYQKSNVIKNIITEPPKVITKKYIPRKHQIIEETEVKMEKITSKTKPTKKLSITLANFKKEMEKPEFIDSFVKSITDLMYAKLEFYKIKLQETKKEHTTIKSKITRMKEGGVDAKHIEEIFPSFNLIHGFIIEIEDIMSIIRNKINNISAKSVYDGLSEAINDPDNGIASIIGRQTIKNQLISQIYAFSKGYRTFLGSFNNIAIYGSAGVGKTRLALTISFIFSKAGILATDNIKITSKTDLVGRYVGHTGPKTRGVLMTTLEGVLFIDEAYQLTASEVGSNDYGSEAITELVNFLDKYIGMSLVIVAGYEEVMTRNFMTFNEGLPRRFPYKYKLPPYSNGELTDILMLNILKRTDVKVDSKTSNFLFTLISKIIVDHPDVFKNQAGDMLNLATMIVKTINSSYEVQWKNNDLEHNTPIILEGFDEFLTMKNLKLTVM